MTDKELQHVQVPLTDFVRGIAEHAAKVAVEEHARKSCPYGPRVAALEESGRSVSSRVWDCVKIVAAAVIAFFLGSAAK